MDARKVNVFFYGSYINFEVLAEVDIDERKFEVVSLPNFRLSIGPHANIERNASSTCFGILTRLTHSEIGRLYDEHATKILGNTYLPEPVVVYSQSGSLIPAMTYICQSMKPAKPDPGYVDRILVPAKRYGFPGEYLDFIESFK